MPSLRVRRFRLADLDRLMEIERASFPKVAYPRDLFLELYEDCGSLFFVALLGGTITGYSVTCTRLPRAELVSIAVDPLHRRMGVARKLLAHTLARLRSAGAATFSLMVRARNRKAIALYRGLGFRRTARVAGYYENREDGVRMRLNLL
jgi:ribosomal-protein-alanine N-acetyltransferase